MNAMTLLRGMAMLDPSDLEAARLAGAGEPADCDTDGLTDSRSGSPEQHPQLRRRIADIIAAAACLTLVVTGVLLLHRSDPGFVLASSHPDDFEQATRAETTETVTETTFAAYTGEMPVTERTEITVTADETALTVTEQTDTTAALPEMTTSAAAETTAAPVSSVSPETTTAAALPASVDVLAVMGDCAGTLPAGSPQTEIMTDRTQIQAYLESGNPETIRGDGGKSPQRVQEILSDPVLIRIRWETDRPLWESYGFEELTLTSDGILHVRCAFYGGMVPEDNDGTVWWVYDTALLCSASELPQIRGIDAQADEFREEYDAAAGDYGITQWLSYERALMSDLKITTKEDVS